MWCGATRTSPLVIQICSSPGSVSTNAERRKRLATNAGRECHRLSSRSASAAASRSSVRSATSRGRGSSFNENSATDSAKPYGFKRPLSVATFSRRSCSGSRGSIPSSQITRQPSACRPRAHWRYTHRCPPPWRYARVRAGAMQIVALMILGSLWSAQRQWRTPNAPPCLRPVEDADGGVPVRRSNAQVLSIEIAVHQRLRHAVTDLLHSVPVRRQIVETSLNPFDEEDVVWGQDGIVQILLHQFAGRPQVDEVASRAPIGEPPPGGNIGRRGVKQPEPAGGLDAVLC